MSELPAGGSKLGSVIPEHPPLVFKAKLALQVKHLFPSRVWTKQFVLGVTFGILTHFLKEPVGVPV